MEYYFKCIKCKSFFKDQHTTEKIHLFENVYTTLPLKVTVELEGYSVGEKLCRNCLLKLLKKVD